MPVIDHHPSPEMPPRPAGCRRGFGSYHGGTANSGGTNSAVLPGLSPALSIGPSLHLEGARQMSRPTSPTSPTSPKSAEICRNLMKD
jgi:hypothetical protein